MRKFGKYFGILVVFFILILSIEYFNQYAKSLAGVNFDYTLSSFVYMIGWFLFGLFLGSLNLIREFKEDGSWKVNKEGLLALGLPLFIILVLYSIAYLEIVMPQMVETLLFFIVTKDIIKYIAAFLGYIAMSSLTKKS
jgi:hypothetical protein